MRECHGLVDALVTYINHALDVGKCEDKVRGSQCRGSWEQTDQAGLGSDAGGCQV